RFFCFFFFSSRRRHTRFSRDWSSDVCSSDLLLLLFPERDCRQLVPALQHAVAQLFQGCTQLRVPLATAHLRVGFVKTSGDHLARSEERRVGKECRSRWSA